MSPERDVLKGRPRGWCIRARPCAACDPARGCGRSRSAAPFHPSIATGLPQLFYLRAMRRCFAIDVQKCPRCSGRMKLRALVTEAPGIQRLLHHLGEPTEPPGLSPARAPPFYKSRVLRRRSPESRTDAATFEAIRDRLGA